MTYAEKLKDPRWQKKRLKIMSRDKWKCRKCGDDKTTLQVHYKKYYPNTEPWDYEDKYLITVCENCHEIIETLKDKCDFDDINIEKLCANTGMKIILISFNETCELRILDENGNLNIWFILLRESSKKIIKFLTRFYNNFK